MSEKPFWQRPPAGAQEPQEPTDVGEIFQSPVDECDEDFKRLAFPVDSSALEESAPDVEVAHETQVEPSEACRQALEDLRSMHLGQPGGILRYGTTDESLIAEIRQHCPPEILRRVGFGASPRGAIG